MTDLPCRCRAGVLHPGPAAAGRRALMGAGLAAAAAVALAGPPRTARAADPVPKTDLTPDQALNLLKEGNDNFRM
jgi:carbonic anhydrase